jgi:hypothetical protein
MGLAGMKMANLTQMVNVIAPIMPQGHPHLRSGRRGLTVSPAETG